MDYKIISILCLFLCFNLSAQQYLAKDGRISFFSEAPLEDITAVNNKVKAVFDSQTKEIVFQLNIKDFIFPKKLMQEHFNENYLESDIYPKSIFQGIILHSNLNKETDGNTRVEGDLSIHGKTNKIIVEGKFLESDDRIIIKANFPIKLEDYNISIPKIVMYKIAEEIDVSVDIELIKIL